MDRKDLETKLDELRIHLEAALSARQNKEVLRTWFAHQADALRQAAGTEVDLSYVEARLAILIADNQLPP